MKPLTLSVEYEPKDKFYWGRVEDVTSFMPNGGGETMEKMIKDVRDCIEDYLEHEGKDDSVWQAYGVDVAFDIVYETPIPS